MWTDNCTPRAYYVIWYLCSTSILCELIPVLREHIMWTDTFTPRAYYVNWYMYLYSTSILCELIHVPVFHEHIMGIVARKPVFEVSTKASFKPVSSATETILKIGISPVASLHIIFSKKRITKAIVRLRGSAGWSAPVLFANPRRQVFSHRDLYLNWYFRTFDINTLICFHSVVAK